MTSVLPAVVLLLVSLMPARALELSGRISTDIVGYGTTLSSLNNDNASLKFYATITPSRSMDAAFIINAERRTYFNASGLQNYNYRELYLRYRTGRLSMRLGRQYLPEALGTNLDGVRVQFKSKSRLSSGFYAGIKADPYRRGTQGDYSIYGAFAAFKGRKLDASASYSTEFYKGSFNRGYMTLQSSARYKNRMRLYGNLTIDTDSDYKPNYLTYVNLGANVTPHRRFNFSLAYSRYQAYQEFAVPDLSYFTSFFPTHRYSLRGRAKITANFSIDASRSVSLRDYNGTRTHYYSISLNSWGWGVPGMNAYISRTRSWGDYYFSVTSTIGASYAFARKYSISSSISHQWNQTRFAAAEAAGYIVYNSFRTSFWKRFNVSLSHHFNSSAGPAQNGLYTHLGYRF